MSTTYTHEFFRITEIEELCSDGSNTLNLELCDDLAVAFLTLDDADAALRIEPGDARAISTRLRAWADRPWTPDRTERDRELDESERQIRELLERMRATENTRELLALLDQADDKLGKHAALLQRGVK